MEHDAKLYFEFLSNQSDFYNNNITKPADKFVYLCNVVGFGNDERNRILDIKNNSKGISKQKDYEKRSNNKTKIQ